MNSSFVSVFGTGAVVPVEAAEEPPLAAPEAVFFFDSGAVMGMWRARCVCAFDYWYMQEVV